MRPRKDPTRFIYRTNLVIKSLARRIKSLDAEMRTIDQTLRSLIEETAPSMLELYGVVSTPQPHCWRLLGTIPNGFIRKVLGASLWCHPTSRQLRQDNHQVSVKPGR